MMNGILEEYVITGTDMNNAPVDKRRILPTQPPDEVKAELIDLQYGKCPLCHQPITLENSVVIIDNYANSDRTEDNLIAILA